MNTYPTSERVEKETPAVSASSSYEAPIIEHVITPQDLEVEAFYAGVPLSGKVIT